MRNILILLLITGITGCFISSYSFKTFSKKQLYCIQTIDTIKPIDSIYIDSLKVEAKYNYKLYKRNAHASYYANKFNGKRTASGERFDNNNLTAAHRKIAFGTKLRITNTRNGKQTIVRVNDRGPFVKGREIDLSRKAFMTIANNKAGGEMNVTIEVQQKKE